MVRFVEDSLSFNKLNISHTDIPCVLENNDGEAARSTQAVTLYITLNITPPNLCSSPPSMSTRNKDSLAEEAAIPGRIQPSIPEHHLPFAHHEPVETGNTIPQSPEEELLTSTKNPRPDLHGVDEAMKRIDRSNTWERAVGRIKWVMDTLGPIAEVRIMPS